MNKSHKGIMFFAIILIIGICSITGYVMLDRLGGNIYNNSTSDISLNSWKLVLDIDDNNVSIDKTNIKINGSIDANSEVSYNLTIKNKGSIKAYLYSITNSNNDITVTLKKDDKEISNGLIVKPSKDEKVKLVIKNKKDEKIDFEDNIKLIFNQYNKED